MTILYLLFGLLLLIAGGEALVRGAASLGRASGLSPLVVGMTIVGFGTSTPELLVSLQAALQDESAIAVGNVVGSNIANLLLILGCVSLIRPIPCSLTSLSRDALWMVGATLLCTALAFHGEINRLTGGLLLAGLLLYIRTVLSAQEGSPEEKPAETIASTGVLWLGVQFACGLAVLLVGCNWLVSGAVQLAKWLQVSEAVIGLTVVAVGTSLPELAASVIAAVRKQSDMALGNVLGSNLFNILGILGITALVEPISIDPVFLRMDIWVMLGCAVGVLPFLRTGWKLSRTEGAIFVSAYVLYTIWLYRSAVA